MHELTLCRNIVDTAERYMQMNEAKEVMKVTVELGSQAPVDLSALAFGFTVIAQHSAIPNARLEIIEIKAQAHCDYCDRVMEVDERVSKCPDCGHWMFTLARGEELRVKSIEVV